MIGTFQGRLPFSKIEIYTGRFDGKIHSELSLVSLGVMHEQVENIEAEDNKLKFKLKVKDIFWQFSIEKVANCYKGKLEYGTEIFKFDLEKKSDSYIFLQPYSTIPVKNIELLKKYNDYLNNNKSTIIRYELNNKEVKRYLSLSGLNFQESNSFDNVLQIMKIICRKFHQNDVIYTNSNKYGTITNIKWTLKHNGYTSKRGMATILAGILRSYGFVAGHTICLAYDDDTEYHVVVEVFIPEYNKFVMVDPTMNLVIFNKGIPQNLYEIREALIANEKLTCNEDASHNGNSFNLVEYLGYISKSLFCFQKCFSYDEINDIEEANSITLIPLQYNSGRSSRITTKTSDISVFYGMPSK